MTRRFLTQTIAGQAIMVAITTAVLYPVMMVSSVLVQGFVEWLMTPAGSF